MTRPVTWGSVALLHARVLSLSGAHGIHALGNGAADDCADADEGTEDNDGTDADDHPGAVLEAEANVEYGEETEDTEETEATEATDESPRRRLLS